MSLFGYSVHSRGLFTCLLALLLSISPLPVLSSDAVSVCFVEWRPYTRMTDTGAEGISVSIMRRAAELLGRELRFEEHGWNECLQKVKDGELDVILDAAERSEYLQGPTSFSIYSDTFWVNNDSDISRFEQLTGARLALVDGYLYDERLLAHIKNLELKVVWGGDDQTIVRDLAAGKVDAVIADLASTFIFVREENLDVHPILPPFTFDKLYASFNSEKTDLQREFDRAFAQLIEQGYVNEVYEKILGTTYSSFITSE